MTIPQGLDNDCADNGGNVERCPNKDMVSDDTVYMEKRGLPLLEEADYEGAEKQTTQPEGEVIVSG